MTRILVIDDDDNMRENIAELLRMEKYEVMTAEDGERGIELAIQRGPDLIVCDVTMPGMDGFQVFEVLSGQPGTAVVPFIFLSARSERTDVRRGMALGADDFITKPFARMELLGSISARLRRRPADRPEGAAPQAASPAKAPSRSSAPPPGHVMVDPAILGLLEQLERAAPRDISILLLGETGVGKEVLARETHRLSGRKGPFVAVNCGALTESLLESELFGYEKGAFTGALQARPGLFEAADGGTLFLDEVGELSPSTQVKLLRALEDKQVVRVGGRVPRALDLRFVSATNRNLEQAMLGGEFRQDLYYRLNGLTLEVPPLRERTTDILALAEHFLKLAAGPLGSAPGLSVAAQGALLRYPWPGNIRELRNVMERAVLLCGDDSIELCHLPVGFQRAESAPSSSSDPRAPLLDRLQEMERRRIVAALDQCGGNQTQAASMLGISRRTLVTRLSQFELPRPRKR